MTAQDYRVPESIDRVRQRALIVGVIGLLVCILGLIRSPERFYPSYLLAFIFVLGLSLGSLGLLMLQHLTGGNWGIIIRRPLESATRALPLLAVLFIPIFFGMKYLYAAWLGAPPSGEGALSEFQRSYLTPNGFRDVVARELIEPVYTFSNGPQPLRVYRREDVERLAAGRRMYAETEPRLRVAMGLKRAEQAKLPGTLRRGEW